MMNCERVEQLLSEQLEGAVSEREARAMEAHLGQCPACRRRQEEFQAIRSRLRALVDHLPLPASAPDRSAIDRWLSERGASPGSGRRWFWPSSTVSLRSWAGDPGLKPRSVRDESRRRGLGRRTRGGGFGSGTDGGFNPGLSLAGAAVTLLLAVLAFHWRGHGPSTQPPRVEVARHPAPDAHSSALQPSPHIPSHGAEREIANRPSIPTGRSDASLPDSAVAVGSTNRGHGSQSISPPSHTPPHLRRGRVEDDLVYLNGDPLGESRRWVTLRPDERARIEAKVRHDVRVRDDFVTIPFPLLASTSDRQIAEAVESYKREAAVTDPRLVREVTCAFKATALSDLCSQLQNDASIELSAGPSVADDKVTLLCEKMSLRDVMRQLSRPFGYTWLRSGTPGQYRYELEQDLRAQLQEEELRNRDRDQALIALDREMAGYQPYLALSPGDAQARARTAAPETKKLLEALAGPGWGPIHMYFRLSPQELATLRAGGTITFSADPKPGEQALPPDVARTVLQSLRESPAAANQYAMATDAGAGPVKFQGRFQMTSPGGALPSPDDPDAQARVSLSLSRSELGRFTLSGLSGVATSGGMMMRGTGPYAVGTSPVATQTDNSAVDARLATDPALRRRISVQPKPHCWEPTFSGPGELPAFGPMTAAGPGPLGAALSEAGDGPGQLEAVPLPPGQGSLHGETIGGGPGRSEAAPGEGVEPAQSKTQNPKSKIGKVNSADVLEALHMATGLPVVADFYTHLYSPEAVSVTNQPIFAALNQLAGAMKLRWDKQGKWLQFRTASFYNDRLKEVPNRLLARWSAARQKSGWLPLAQLLEMARCSDAQIDAADMAEGIRVCWGLPEWDLVRGAPVRPQLRFLAGFSEPQLREAMSPAGLAFTRMSLAQQQQFLALGMGPNANPSLDELAGASLHVEYLQPGSFRWTPTESAGPAGARPRSKTFGARGPGGLGAPSSGVRLLESQTLQGSDAWRWLPGLSPVVAPTRQAALQAARRLNPQAQPSQIMPTDLSVTLVYVWGSPKTGGMASAHRLAASQSGLGMMQMRQPLPPIGDAEPAAAPR